MPMEGLEPSIPKAADFESAVYTNSTTSAANYANQTITRQKAISAKQTNAMPMINAGR